MAREVIAACCAGATHILVQRQSKGKPWETWGFVNTTQDAVSDDPLTTASAWSYRIAARNAGGSSAFVVGRRDTVRRAAR